MCVFGFIFIDIRFMVCSWLMLKLMVEWGRFIVEVSLEMLSIWWVSMFSRVWWVLEVSVLVMVSVVFFLIIRILLFVIFIVFFIFGFKEVVSLCGLMC